MYRLQLSNHQRGSQRMATSMWVVQTKQNKTKQNKTKQNKTKQNKNKQKGLKRRKEGKIENDCGKRRGKRERELWNLHPPEHQNQKQLHQAHEIRFDRMILWHKFDNMHCSNHHSSWCSIGRWLLILVSWECMQKVRQSNSTEQSTPIKHQHVHSIQSIAPAFAMTAWSLASLIPTWEKAGRWKRAEFCINFSATFHNSKIVQHNHGSKKKKKKQNQRK